MAAISFSRDLSHPGAEPRLLHRQALCHGAAWDARGPRGPCRALRAGEPGRGRSLLGSEVAQFTSV